MTERQRRILSLLVEAYIASGHPVASGLLAQQLSVSPATCRYDLAELTEAGYVIKLHASAGRLPTRNAFRYYALSLLPPSLLPEEVLERLALILERAGQSWAKLVGQMAANLSGYATVLRLARVKNPRLIQVHLSALGGGRMLVVAIMEGGLVQNSLLELDFDPSESLLQQAEQLLRGPMEEEAPFGRPWDSSQLETLLHAAQQVYQHQLHERYLEGARAVLSEPEAMNPEFLRRAFTLLETPSKEPLTPPGNVNLRVGETEGLSMVQAGFIQGGVQGEISLVGPLRMRYKDALSVAHSLSHTLNQESIHAGYYAD